MGSTSSRPSPLAPTFQRMSDWTVKDAKRLLSEYKEKDLDFGLDVQGLTELVSGDSVWAEAIIDAFGETNGIVNALAFICGAILISTGPAIEKAGLAFDALDFDMTEQISMDEMTILFLCCARGYSVMAAVGKIPSDEELESVTLKAYRELSKSVGNSITKNEFTKWAIKFIGSAATAIPHAEVSLGDMAAQFGLVTPEVSIAKSTTDEVLRELAEENNATPAHEERVHGEEETSSASADEHTEACTAAVEESPPTQEVEDAYADDTPRYEEEPIIHSDEAGDKVDDAEAMPQEASVVEITVSDPEPSQVEASDEAAYGTDFVPASEEPHQEQGTDQDEAYASEEVPTPAEPSEEVAPASDQEPVPAPTDAVAEVASTEDQPSPRVDLNAYDTYDYQSASYDGSSGLPPPEEPDEVPVTQDTGPTPEPTDDPVSTEAGKDGTIEPVPQEETPALDVCEPEAGSEAGQGKPDL